MIILKSTETGADGGAGEALEAEDFLEFGVDMIAYVKISDEDEGCYAIHAADGTELTVIETRELAGAVAQQNDIELLSVH